MQIKLEAEKNTVEESKDAAEESKKEALFDDEDKKGTKENPKFTPGLCTYISHGRKHIR